jgi:hypothetical protein
MTIVPPEGIGSTRSANDRPICTEPPSKSPKFAKTTGIDVAVYDIPARENLEKEKRGARQVHMRLPTTESRIRVPQGITSFSARTPKPGPIITPVPANKPRL